MKRAFFLLTKSTDINSRRDQSMTLQRLALRDYNSTRTTLWTSFAWR